MQPRLAAPLMGVPNGANQAPLGWDAPLAWDPAFEYPAPLIVRNTFIEFNARPPSFEEFVQERKVQSCPPAVEGENQPPALAAPPSPPPVGAAPGGRASACSTLLAPSGAQGPVVYYSHAGLQGAPSSTPAPLGFGTPAEALRPPWASPPPATQYPVAAAAGIGAARPRHAAPTNSQLLAAQLAAPGHGGGLEACPALAPGPLPAASPLAGPSPVPPWRQAGSRHHKQAPQRQDMDLGAASPGCASSGCYAGSPLPTPGRMAPTSHIAAAGGDEPVESSSGEESASERRGGPSDSAAIGSAACPTVGSRGHSLRMCKPCAFVTKGCQGGVDCKFCHLCEVGEKKRRKKEKVAFRREVQKWRQQSGSPMNANANANGNGNGNGNGWNIGGFW